jgi:hypothetical protein
MRATLLCFCLSVTAFGQQKGLLGTSFARAPWPSPESVVTDLRSQDDPLRRKALRLVGLTEDQTGWTDGSVEKPTEIKLLYAPLGKGPELQAVVAFSLADRSYEYAAVAAPGPRGWTRIGSFNCWCKYENGGLSDFVEVSPRSELVLRASAGGTGIYAKEENHFRIRDGLLRNVISFEIHSWSCLMGDDLCTRERREFSGNQLVETHEKFNGSDFGFTNPLSITVTCTPYQWNEEAFLYKRTGPPKKCSNPAPSP